MPTSYRELEEQVLALSLDDRTKLVHTVPESLHPVDPAHEAIWADEVERRIAAYDRGETEAYDADEVFAEIRRRCR
jgi:putative addiction module component (TIGR02574 family)